MALNNVAFFYNAIAVRAALALLFGSASPNIDALFFSG